MGDDDSQAYSVIYDMKVVQMMSIPCIASYVAKLLILPILGLVK